MIDTNLNFRCCYCGRYGGELHCDHVIPPAKGGSHAEWNLRTVCRDHHLARHPEKALKYNYFYKKSSLSNFTSRHDRPAAKANSDARFFLRMVKVMVVLAILCLLEQFLWG